VFASGVEKGIQKKGGLEKKKKLALCKEEGKRVSGSKKILKGRRKKRGFPTKLLRPRKKKKKIVGGK